MRDSNCDREIDEYRAQASGVAQPAASVEAEDLPANPDLPSSIVRSEGREAERLRAIAAQVADVARLLRIKADSANLLAAHRGDLDKDNWSGLAIELNDAAQMLEELAAGRDVPALVQGRKNRAAALTGGPSCGAESHFIRGKHCAAAAGHDGPHEYHLSDPVTRGWTPDHLDALQDRVQTNRERLVKQTPVTRGGPSPQATDGLLRERLEGMVSWWDGKFADAVTGQDAEDLLSALHELLSDTVTP